MFGYMRVFNKSWGMLPDTNTYKGTTRDDTQKPLLVYILERGGGQKRKVAKKFVIPAERNK